jgi:hypothetical protein
MLRRVALVRTDVSEKLSASIIRVTYQKTPFFIVTAVKTSDLIYLGVLGKHFIFLKGVLYIRKNPQILV